MMLHNRIFKREVIYLILIFVEFVSRKIEETGVLGKLRMVRQKIRVSRRSFRASS